jgi:hypothetical protein
MAEKRTQKRIRVYLSKAVDRMAIIRNDCNKKQKEVDDCPIVVTPSFGLRRERHTQKAYVLSFDLERFLQSVNIPLDFKV